MESGVIGRTGVHALTPVEMELDIELGGVMIRNQLMEEWNVLETTLKKRSVMKELVQVNYYVRINDGDKFKRKYFF